MRSLKSTFALFCILTAGLGGPGCSAPEQSAGLHILVSGLTPNIAQLRVEAALATTAAATTKEYTAAPELGLWLPADASGQVTVRIVGVSALPCDVAVGQGSTEVGPGIVELPVALSAAPSASGCEMRFQEVKPPIPTDSRPPLDLVMGDLIGGPQVDLAVRRADGTIWLMEGLGDGSLVRRTVLTPPGPAYAMVVGDLDHKSKTDLAISHSQGPSDWPAVGVELNGLATVTQVYQTGQSHPLLRGMAPLVAADFNGDGKLDLASCGTEGMSSAPNINLALGRGDGGFASPVVRYPITVPALSMAGGDFDGDGHADLAIASDSQVTVALGWMTDRFKITSSVFTDSRILHVAVGDLNDDGDADLVVVSTSSQAGLISILLGDGHGAFAPPQSIPVSTLLPEREPSARPLAMGDFSGDGKLDLAILDPSSNRVSLLLGLGGGAFKLIGSQPTGASPVSVTAGDLNGDGRLDLAVSNLLGNSISILLNTSY